MKKTNSELFDIIGGSSSSKDKFTHRPAVNIHELYLSGAIKAPEEYVEWYDLIRNATAQDIIKIYINSYGGDLFAAIQFLRVLRETPASTIVSIEGACMSAATIPFLCADQVEVSPHSMFMFHNYSGGTIGKGGEMFEQLKHEREWSAKLLKDVYAHFLTEDEIDDMLNNKDIWMDGEEVCGRLEKRMEILEAEAEAEEKEGETEESTED